jgi:hypothetical protein
VLSYHSYSIKCYITKDIIQIGKMVSTGGLNQKKQLHRPSGEEDASVEESDDAGAPFHHSFSHSPNMVFLVACFHDIQHFVLLLLSER